MTEQQIILMNALFSDLPRALFLAFVNDSPDYKSDHISLPQTYFSWVSGKLTSIVHTTARILQERIQSTSRIKSTASKLLPNGTYPGDLETQDLVMNIC